MLSVLTMVSMRDITESEGVVGAPSARALAGALQLPSLRGIRASLRAMLRFGSVPRYRPERWNDGALGRFMEDPPDWGVEGGNEGPPGWDDFIREADRRWDETEDAPDHGEPEPPDDETRPGRPRPQWKPIVRYTAVWRQGTHAELQAYGWPYADYRRAYDNPLWGNGYRLTHLTPYRDWSFCFTHHADCLA